MPSVKEFVRKVCKKKIKYIYCQSIELQDQKAKLLAWLRHRNYRHDDDYVCKGDVRFSCNANFPYRLDCPPPPLQKNQQLTPSSSDYSSSSSDDTP